MARSVIVYSNKPLDFLKGVDHVIYANPRFFVKPMGSAAYYWTDDPDIAAAYEKRGIPKYPMVGSLNKVVKPEVIEDWDDNWRELSWPKLRSLAAQFTNQPVKNKEHAMEVLISVEDMQKKALETSTEV